MKPIVSYFLFAICLFFYNTNTNAQIFVSGGFEGSNIVDINQISATSFTCKLITPTMPTPESNYYNVPGDHYHNWFMLKIENAVAQTVTVSITNADYGSGPFWGRADGKAVYLEAADPYALSSDTLWQKLTTATYSNPNFTFTITPASNIVWVALSYPSAPTHIANWISSLSSSPYVTAEIVATTSEGRPLQMLFITDNAFSLASKKGVIVYGQEHSNEQTGAWTCQGLAEFLVSGDTIAQTLLKNVVFIIIPDENPDASASGTCNDPNNGMGAQWRYNPAAIDRMMLGMNAPMNVESKGIFNRVKSFVENGGSVDICLNIHQGGVDNFYGVYELADSKSSNFDLWLKSFMPQSGATWIPNTLGGYSRGG